MSLFSFIYNTFQERINLKEIGGKTNDIYLPSLLANIDDPDDSSKKLLPLTADSWYIGEFPDLDVSAISCPFANLYWNTVYLVQILSVLQIHRIPILI